MRSNNQIHQRFQGMNRFLGKSFCAQKLKGEQYNRVVSEAKSLIFMFKVSRAPMGCVYLGTSLIKVQLLLGLNRLVIALNNALKVITKVHKNEHYTSPLHTEAARSVFTVQKYRFSDNDLKKCFSEHLSL